VTHGAQIRAVVENVLVPAGVVALTFFSGKLVLQIALAGISAVEHVALILMYPLTPLMRNYTQI